MRAFGTVGYYLSDESYSKYEKNFINMVDYWFANDKSVVWIWGLRKRCKLCCKNEVQRNNARRKK